MAEPVDEADIELALAVHGELAAALAVKHRGGPVARGVLEGAGRLRVAHLFCGQPLAGSCSNTRWVGKIIRPGSSRLTSTAST